VPNQTDGDLFGLLVKVLLRKMLDGGTATKLTHYLEAARHLGLRTSSRATWSEDLLRRRGRRGLAVQSLGDVLALVQHCRRTCSEDEVAVGSRCSLPRLGGARSIS